MENEVQVPPGYRRDARGNLVPEKNIKPIDVERDALVMSIIPRARTISELLTNFRKSCFEEIAAFVALSLEQYGVKHGGVKGNIQLLSFDGRYKVLIAVQENIQFDERLQAAKALIDECLSSWTANAEPQLVSLINEAFRVDQAGKIRTGMVLSLRRYNIKDEKWKAAMDAISDAVMVTGSKSYVRVYERVGDTDEYQQINLSLAGA